MYDVGNDKIMKVHDHQKNIVFFNSRMKWKIEALLTTFKISISEIISGMKQKKVAIGMLGIILKKDHKCQTVSYLTMDKINI